MWTYLLLSAVLCLAEWSQPGSAVQEEKVCIITKDGSSMFWSTKDRYNYLRDTYSNCTIVEGNLILDSLWVDDLDMSFLDQIREVTGFVLIQKVEVRRILLPRLEIVRGRPLLRLKNPDEAYALLVLDSTAENLQFPSLLEIQEGDVYFQNIDNLCYIRTINWSEILSGSDAKVVYNPKLVPTKRECPSCHESCEAGCWGEGPNNCQLFSNISCLPQCNQEWCFGPEPRQCCHLFCSGGCAGPTQADCLLAFLLVIGYFSKQIIGRTV